MNKIYLIEDWQGGYWSEERQQFKGIIFATRYLSEWQVEQAIIKIKTEDGPMFIKIGWEKDKQDKK